MPLDHRMERWIKRGDCFYARFQDDIVLIFRKLEALHRIRLEMFQILKELCLGLGLEKTFVGISHKNFDLLGYPITLKGLSPSTLTQEKPAQKALRHYMQGGNPSQEEYPRVKHEDKPEPLENLGLCRP